jgi:hypothetical protein
VWIWITQNLPTDRYSPFSLLPPRFSFPLLPL